MEDGQYTNYNQKRMWEQEKERRKNTDHASTDPKAKTIEPTRNLNDWGEDERIRWSIKNTEEVESYYNNMCRTIKKLKDNNSERRTGPYLLKKLTQRKRGLLGILVEREGEEYLLALKKSEKKHNKLMTLISSLQPLGPIMLTSSPAGGKTKRNEPNDMTNTSVNKKARCLVSEPILPTTLLSVMKDYLPPQKTTVTMKTTAHHPQKKEDKEEEEEDCYVEATPPDSPIVSD
jgi:hypothetical protein